MQHTRTVKRAAITASAICIGGVLAAPASADAAYISKREARHYVVKTVRDDLYPDMDWAVGYWVERARSCDRLSRRTVECDYELYGDEGFTCYDAVRIVAGQHSYRVRFPYDADCEDDGS